MHKLGNEATKKKITNLRLKRCLVEDAIWVLWRSPAVLRMTKEQYQKRKRKMDSNTENLFDDVLLILPLMRKKMSCKSSISKHNSRPECSRG